MIIKEDDGKREDRDVEERKKRKINEEGKVKIRKDQRGKRMI